MQGQASGLHPLWREVQCLNDRLLYMNPFTGALSQTGFDGPPPVKGGILCDGEHYTELCIVLWLSCASFCMDMRLCTLLGPVCLLRIYCQAKSSIEQNGACRNGPGQDCGASGVHLGAQVSAWQF